jgi:hypothetical protein
MSFRSEELDPDDPETEMADRSANAQLLIAYGRGPRASVIYTTAYTRNAAQAALERCIAQHGQWVCARVVTDHPSQASAL